MDFFDTVNKRHSYRGEFEDTPIPRDDLRKIVQVGLQAPSGKNAQTTTFVIVDDPEIITAIATIRPIPVIATAKALIACVIDKEPKKIFHGMSFEVEDCAVATENMLLAITALGYASVWIDGALRIEGRAEMINKILEIPEDKTIRILLPIGIAKEHHLPKEKKPFEERAWFI